MNIKKSKYQIAVDVLGILLWVGVWGYLIIGWSGFPDKIPGHYGISGNVDRWGNKGELLIVPIMGCLIWLGMAVTERFPQIWNTGVTVTKENQERVYRVLKNMICTERFLMTAIFVFLTIHSTIVKPLPIWFTPVFLGLVFGSIAFFLIRLVRIK